MKLTMKEEVFVYIAKTDNWYLERVIWLVAGIMTALSALLTWLHSPYWIILTGLISLNLLIFAFTGFCIMANILYKVGIKSRIE